MKNIFKYTGISNRAWNNFVDKGKVDDRIIRIIAFRIIEGTQLTERELAIFYSKTAEINEMLITLKRK